MVKINTRNQLGKFFQSHFKAGIGAEVGVQKGWFSYILSQDWKGKIICIDPWEDNYDIVKECLKDRNVELVRKTSVEAAKDIEDESLDWVYIDALHDYESGVEDIKTWYPKVRKGGVVAGHDYINVVMEDWDPKVFAIKKAVDEFAEQNNYKVTEIPDDWVGWDSRVRRFPSWYFIKKIK
jgi:predicted O-methyltransferase YrrM